MLASDDKSILILSHRFDRCVLKKIGTFLVQGGTQSKPGPVRSHMPVGRAVGCRQRVQ